LPDEGGGIGEAGIGSHRGERKRGSGREGRGKERAINEIREGGSQNCGREIY